MWIFPGYSHSRIIPGHFQKMSFCLGCQVTVLGSPDKLEAFLARCGGGGSSRKGKKPGKDGASWGGCVLLFSDKKQTSPLFKSLASQYAGKLAFGEVRFSSHLPRPLARVVLAICKDPSFNMDGCL